ncbi:hypothetical protein PanWU01x14_332820 [Parasponia andersonii]|uniref:Uncharacterized protein n=1 Tax=Parasponia andersonii TaxID=3476 RepID=A0A2P5AH72_PARAD|nr:hypothetical protein PanWU01x14_332820 [Parasponia andersonii]
MKRVSYGTCGGCSKGENDNVGLLEEEEGEESENDREVSKTELRDATFKIISGDISIGPFHSLGTRARTVIVGLVFLGREPNTI